MIIFFGDITRHARYHAMPFIDAVLRTTAEIPALHAAISPHETGDIDDDVSSPTLQWLAAALASFLSTPSRVYALAFLMNIGRSVIFSANEYLRCDY